LLFYCFLINIYKDLPTFFKNEVLDLIIHQDGEQQKGLKLRVLRFYDIIKKPLWSVAADGLSVGFFVVLLPLA